MTGPHHESRHYTVLGLIGRGGQGNVYHARMEGGEGFRKDVAIKLLKEGLSQDSIQRFRDEARMLGLVRDRSIITVDPPIRLGGRWAIVMEYVDGVSVGRLLRAGGLPATVALDIVAEIARVLNKVYQSVGPDGRPLCLVHRDIKPGNLQLSEEGEVKLLDFGVARAEFQDREAWTEQHIGGTLGFIAPERVKGLNGPACDIYSLGVTLRVMLTAEKPTALAPLPDGPPGPVLTLAEEMRRENPDERPTAREVERRAREIRALLTGPSLQQWAEEVVPGMRLTLEDPLVGMVLTESVEYGPVSGLTSMAEALPPPARRPVVPVLAALALLALSALLVVGFGWWSGTGPPVEPVAAAEAPLAPPAAPPAPVVAEPEPAVPPPTPTPPKPVAPRPAPVAVSAVPIEVLSSVPAKVWLDGKLIGVTGLHGKKVTEGSHRLKLAASDGRTVEATVLVGGRHGSTRFEWDGGPSLGAR